MALALFVVQADTLKAQSFLFQENFENPVTDSQKFTTLGTVQFGTGQVELQPGSSMYLNSAYALNDSGSVPIYYSITYDFSDAGSDWGIFSIRMPGGATSGGYEVLNTLNTLAPGFAEFAVGQNFKTNSGFYIMGIGAYASAGALPPVFYTSGPFTITAELWNTNIYGVPATDVSVYMNGMEILSGTSSGSGEIGNGASLGFAVGGNEPVFVSNMEVYTVPEPGAEALAVLAAGAASFWVGRLRCRR
jgi:hypothetical protein